MTFSDNNIYFLGNQRGNAGRRMKNNQSQQSDKNKTKQVRVDVELHRLLKIKAAAEKTSIKALIEGVVADILEVKWTG